MHFVEELDAFLEIVYCLFRRLGVRHRRDQATESVERGPHVEDVRRFLAARQRRQQTIHKGQIKLQAGELQLQG